MRIFYLLLFALVMASCSKDERHDPKIGRDFIEESIQYHDPNNKWADLKATLIFMDSLPPGRESRSYHVSFDNSKSRMRYWIDGLEYEVIEDSVNILEGEIEKERAIRMRDYYLYLWGLPMKLMDFGTKIDDEVKLESLNGIEYHVVRIPYEKDIWYFYLEPETYRLAVYKFYQDEPNLKGEIIYLEGEGEFDGLKIPSNRTWYRTEKPEFLGTDMLLEIKPE